MICNIISKNINSQNKQKITDGNAEDISVCQTFLGGLSCVNNLTRLDSEPLAISVRKFTTSPDPPAPSAKRCKRRKF